MSRHTSIQRPQSGARGRLRTRYDKLWAEGIARIRAGEVELDPVLQARVPDERRGLTVIARPSRAVRQRVTEFLKELWRLEPDQYYYRGSEFHVTVLSLFTATANAGRFFARKAGYISSVNASLKNLKPMPIEFEGITASPGTVIIQGFCQDESLNKLRDALRSQLQRRGLGDGLDQRYRLRTAHLTICRFCNSLTNSERFATTLERARRRSFGTTIVRSLSLVENDWYMSHFATETLRRYRAG